jgi:arginine:ornithine antiporter/lysine permease
VIGFLGVLALLVLVNVLSLGIMSQPELATLQNPSLAAVLEHIVGHWGALLISVGLAISLLGRCCRGRCCARRSSLPPPRTRPCRRS